MVNENNNGPDGAVEAGSVEPEAPKKRSRLLGKAAAEPGDAVEKPKRGLRARKIVAQPKSAAAHVNAEEPAAAVIEIAPEPEAAPAAAVAEPQAGAEKAPRARPTTSLIFQAPPMTTPVIDDEPQGARGGRGQQRDRNGSERGGDDRN